jgi:phage terminase large subunit-like protein
MGQKPSGAPARPQALDRFPNATWDSKRQLWIEGDYWYDERAANAAASFFPRYLRFTTGEWAGRPFHLEPWEEHDIIRPLFGWKRGDETRRFRVCYVWVPRKNGKTELAAGIALLILIGDGELGGQVFSIASDKDQARIVFDKATAMVQWSPDLAPLLECLKTSIYCAQLNAGFKPLSGTPSGKHGLNMSGLVGDEIHEWSDDLLYTYVHQSTAARRQPLEFLISTFGVIGGYGHKIWRYCEQLLDGTAIDPETLVVAYRADPEDDWTDPAVWAKANPNYGVSVKQSYLAAECEKAKVLPHLENAFKQYHLNIWTEQAVRWIPISLWDANKGIVAWQDMPARLKGRRCFAGNDLSQTRDLTCSMLVFPPEEDDELWELVPRFFIPRAAVAERVRRDRVPYDQWIAAGAIIPTEGNVVDYDFVREQYERDAELFQIVKGGFDPWNAMQLMLQLQGAGHAVEQVRQGYLTLSGPSKELERLLLEEQIAHGGHPVLRWCVGNTAVERDAAGNIKPSKAKSTERIDGVAALVTALALAIQGAPEEVEPEVFVL